MVTGYDHLMLIYTIISLHKWGETRRIHTYINTHTICSEAQQVTSTSKSIVIHVFPETRFVALNGWNIYQDFSWNKVTLTSVIFVSFVRIGYIYFFWFFYGLDKLLRLEEMSLYYNLVADYSPRTSDIIEEPLDVQVFNVSTCICPCNC